MILLLHIGSQKLIKTVILESKEEEKQVKTTLISLDRNFSLLMVAVRSSLDHKLQHQQLVLVDFIRWIEHRMKWVGELSGVADLNELFKKLHPYFDFLDCGLIVDMSEQFLNDKYFIEDKISLVSELKEHIAKAESLRCSSTVKELKDKLKTLYSPHLTDLSNMPQIQIELHNPWNEAAIEGLYLLIQHLLPHRSKQSILKYIEIETGSVHIKYIVCESNADCLIAYVQDKLQFMHLIGIFGLAINGKLILKEGENMNFTFESALVKATYTGHNEAVQFLLKLRGDIDHCNEEGITVLMIASKCGHEQVVETLVSAGANVNIQDNEGWTALMIASQNCHAQVIKQLLKEHADVNIQDNKGWTALMIVSQNGYNHIVQQLLEEHADINIQNKEGVTALMKASQKGHTQVVKQLLEKHVNVNIQSKKGVTALMIASQNGHTEIVELLTKELVDIDVQKKDGSTALMLACRCGHVEVAESLLHSHADPHIIDCNGSTAFSLAAYNGNRDLVNMLLDKAEPTTDEIEKAVVTSCYNGHPTLITFLSNKLPHLTNDQRELLDSCVKGDLGTVIMKTLDSPDTPLVLGLTPLMIASSCGHVDMVDALIQAGADVNKQESHFGFTPLFFAISSGKSSSITETLLMYGAHPNVIADNSTPLDVSTILKADIISELLISYGGQTVSQLQGMKEYALSEFQSLLPTLGKEAMSKSFLTTDDITKYEDSSYTVKNEAEKKALEIQSFTSLTTSFT